MPIFGRKREPEIPGWAAPLSPSDFAEFRKQLDTVLSPHGYALGEGFVTVSGRVSQYGLSNLLQQWPLVERSEQLSLIEGHFRGLFQAEDSAPPSGDELLGLLRPRLWGSDALQAVGFPLITRPLATDLEQVLCVDLPTTIVNLKPEQADETGLSADELWEIAYRQIDDGLPIGQVVFPRFEGHLSAFGERAESSSKGGL